MFRVFARSGPGGVSVILATAAAALRKVEEFRDDGFRTVSVLDASGATINEAELTAMAQAESKGRCHEA
ncbi:hypothetical protein [Bradyrhizobium neotropicale]|uniref:hypothetical protein n=1 Tax=Bradyrhizobium neotropicale TaxID=1497615 RepID=UPI001AD7AD70|nr:hypothetical protein [Bradyrhizobium neotropicale]MBO4227429.1 hypothetical protein [Bradyrhizobium neotropicale]